MDPLAMAQALADAAFDAWLENEHRTDLATNVGMGADGTPTMLIDSILDKAIIEQANSVHLSVLSEEAGLVENDGPWLALVDPLDGSRNAARGIPFHCVSVAICDRETLELEAGVIKNLVTGDTYAAHKGQGAYLNGELVQSSDFDPDEVLVAVIADSSTDELKQEQQRRGHHLRDLGSAALELCLVGTGALDAFIVDASWLRIIDVAAGTLFVREAGGVVRDPSTGEDLAMAADVSLRMGIHAAKSKAALEAVT